MKPTSPLEVELVFLHELDRRLANIEKDKDEGRTIKGWEIGGIRNLLNNRLAEVTQQRDKEIQHAPTVSELQ